MMIKYHDTEWGVPAHTDRKMFEFLILETFQAGLSWRTVLHKRQNFRRAFANFDFQKVAKFTNRDVERLMKDSGIIRNRQKIGAAIKNAKAVLVIRRTYGTFCAYWWTFVQHKPQQPNRKSMKDIPVVTALSEKIAQDLKQRGFSFLGPTVVYAHMQATGMVNDHIKNCFRYTRLSRSA